MKLDPPPVQPSPRALKIMKGVSYCTIVASWGFAIGYGSRPSAIENSLFGTLAVHWTWAMIQVLLGAGITLAHFRGGYHVQIAHGIGFIVQSIYCMLWLLSAVLVGAGWFVWPGVFFLAIGHYVLSRLKWPKRGREY